MDKEKSNIEEYSKMVNGNTILLRLEGWIKYIEGFTKGLETTDKVSSMAVLNCVGEILEYMTSFKTELITLLLYCEGILEENEKLKNEAEKKLEESNVIEVKKELELENE